METSLSAERDSEGSRKEDVSDGPRGMVRISTGRGKIRKRCELRH